MDEGTVTTSGVCVFTHFEEIMWGCFKMYCRWKGTHAHVTVSFLFYLSPMNHVLDWGSCWAVCCVHRCSGLKDTDKLKLIHWDKRA